MGIPGFIALQTGSTEIDTCPGSSFELCEVPTSTTWAIAGLLYFAAFVGAVVYFGIMEGKGATVGKNALSIRTVDQNTGQPIGTGRSIGRYFARWISAIPCALGYLWMLWDDQQQTWHDKMTTSVVITE